MMDETPDPTAPKSGEDVGPAAERTRWLSVLAVVAAVTIAGGIAVSLFRSHGSDPGAEKTETVAPTRGLACPSLQQAADAYAQGDLVAYNEAIDNALKIAQGTLQISGQAFGEPERIALELGLRKHVDASWFLTQASTACARLGQWSAPGS